MRFRNYCKFSCTSCSVCPSAQGGRARPTGPGDEDGGGLDQFPWFKSSVAIDSTRLKPVTRLDSSEATDSTRLEWSHWLDSTRVKPLTRLDSIRNWNDSTRDSTFSDSTRLVTRPVDDSLQHWLIYLFIFEILWLWRSSTNLYNNNIWKFYKPCSILCLFELLLKNLKCACVNRYFAIENWFQKCACSGCYLHR
jgi:hypothetical protein